LFVLLDIVEKNLYFIFVSQKRRKIKAQAHTKKHLKFTNFKWNWSNFLAITLYIDFQACLNEKSLKLWQFEGFVMENSEFQSFFYGLELFLF